MKYYWISYELAVRIGIETFRSGNGDGYIGYTGDLVGVDIEAETSAGNLTVLTPDEAKQYIKEHKLR
ncbi:MAG: hypothetical protein MJZ08_02450 [Bacteroidaceae bacterium]|nr:hypothetical protein [Bacteroidaceae bacterium]